MKEVEVRTQAELDKAIEQQEKEPDLLIVVCGNGRFEIRETSSPRMVARGTSSPRMEAWGTSSPTMVAWGTSSVTGKIGGYSQPRFWRHAPAQIDIPGAVILEQPEIKTVADWFDYYGVEPEDGIVTLFKAVDDRYISSRSFAYEPGSEPKCEDWNPDPAVECGEGLHFCPAPSLAQGYNQYATKFVACPVAVSDIVLSVPNGSIPDKVRAPKVVGPVWECDINGERVEAVSTDA